MSKTIGGADGPTAIFVNASFSPLVVILGVCVVVGLCAALYFGLNRR